MTDDINTISVWVWPPLKCSTIIWSVLLVFDIFSDKLLCFAAYTENSRCHHHDIKMLFCANKEFFSFLYNNDIYYDVITISSDNMPVHVGKTVKKQDRMFVASIFSHSHQSEYKSSFLPVIDKWQQQFRFKSGRQEKTSQNPCWTQRSSGRFCCSGSGRVLSHNQGTPTLW